MTQIVDPAGNAVAIGYDASFRVTTITDALGQVTTVSYELADDPLKITKVTDPFGRFATFNYASGQLTTITDVIGIQSHFTYLPGTDSIDSLTTPYGTTTFRDRREWNQSLDRNDRPARRQRAGGIPRSGAWH